MLHSEGPAFGRLRVDVHVEETRPETLAVDVKRGLSLPQKTLPAKYFYDDRGSCLFDTICDLPEYYPTRTEQALLEKAADEIVSVAQPCDLVELGSGASRKTRVLIEALLRAHVPARYVPVDVSESMLRRSTQALLTDYPALEIHAIAGDFERHLVHIPNGRRRLAVFLGSTIGNFTTGEATRFLACVAARLDPGDHFLLGVDLLKDHSVLQSAYNDAAGVTAEFNRNILLVVNRSLEADFDPKNFQHVAFFNPDKSQIEMHLQAQRAHEVYIGGLDMTVSFRDGETIHTEVCRKFTRPEAEELLRRAGFEPVRWFEPANRYFGLALAVRREPLCQ